MRAFFLILFLISNLIFSQNHKLPLQQWSYDDLKTTFFKNKGKIEKQKSIANAMLLKAKKENNSSMIARGYYYHSILYENETKVIYFDSIIKNINYLGSEKNFPYVAYHEKGIYFFNNKKYQEAINTYLVLEKLAISKNPIYYFKAKNEIAVIKCEILGEVKEALQLYLECYNFYRINKNKPEIQKDYIFVLFALADVYKTLNENKKATYFNLKGVQETIKNNDEYLKNLFILNEGANQINLKNYKATLDSVYKSTPVIKKHKDYYNLLAAYYYLGKANEGLNNKTLAVKNYLKVDSMFTKIKDITSEFTSGYPFLINYYKKTGNAQKQLYYTNQLMHIDSVLNKNYKQLTKKLTKEYDLPNLVAEKNNTIQNLKNNTFNYKGVLLVFALLILILLYYSYYQRKLKNNSLKQFEALMQQNKIAVLNNEGPNNEKQVKEKSNLGEGIVLKITNYLEKLENENLFLQPNITTQSIAEKLNTNNKYISIVIKEYKNKNFVDYINELRINYAVQKLKAEKKSIQYTIAGLATDFGFNTAESFSNAFFKYTGLKPSFFIKELTKNKSTDNQ